MMALSEIVSTISFRGNSPKFPSRIKYKGDVYAGLNIFVILKIHIKCV